MAVWSCSDFHGNFKAYEVVKNYIGENDIVYYLGDAGDRGPESWRTITAIYNDPQFIYMKGNHEDMLINAIREWQPEHIKGEEYYLLEHNSGRRTFKEWKNSPERNIWVSRLERLPFYLIHVNKNNQIIHLSHAGFTPPTIPCYDEIIWSRYHFNDKWTGKENEFVVHGHTPTSHMTLGTHEVYKYCNGHKIDIDVSTWRTNKVALLNLDTLEPIYLTSSEEKN